MTLVLSLATPAYALHVSDRLVSRGGVPHDPLANKTVVFRGTDGLLALGYTGPAFVRGVPTDTWIADIVSGGSCGRQDGALRLGDFPVRDIGWTLLALARRVGGESLFHRLGLEIMAVGWQWRRRGRHARFRDVLWVLHRGSGTFRWEQLVPRNLPERMNVFRMWRVGDWPASDDDWQRLLDQVGAAGRDWTRAEGLAVQAIRTASALKPGTIGSHCMSVLVQPWRSPYAVIRFKPARPHLATALYQTVETAYSPWMVASDAIHAPAMLVGGMSSDQGLLPYRMEGPDVPDSQALKGAFRTQDRPGR